MYVEGTVALPARPSAGQSAESVVVPLFREAATRVALHVMGRQRVVRGPETTAPTPSELTKHLLVGPNDCPSNGLFTAGLLFNVESVQYRLASFGGQ